MRHALAERGFQVFYPLDLLSHWQLSGVVEINLKWLLSGYIYTSICY